MISPVPLGHSTRFSNAENDSRQPVAEERWSRRKSVLFTASASALSWFVIANPFIIFG